LVCSRRRPVLIFPAYRDHPALPSFPTRRSSDLNPSRAPRRHVTRWCCCARCSPTSSSPTAAASRRRRPRRRPTPTVRRKPPDPTGPRRTGPPERTPPPTARPPTTPPPVPRPPAAPPGADDEVADAWGSGLAPADDPTAQETPAEGAPPGERPRP